MLEQGVWKCAGIKRNLRSQGVGLKGPSTACPHRHEDSDYPLLGFLSIWEHRPCIQAAVADFMNRLDET